MKRILIRAHMSPFDNFDAYCVIKNNTIGTNAGNMIFPYSLFRTLMVDESTIIDTIRTDRTFTEEDISRINDEYDCFILPLTNAFRKTFMHELKIITKLIDKLKIPCIVLGIGLQASVNVKQNDKYEFDYVAKKFVKSVLKKSAVLGLRGEITGSYLTNLGFREGQDFSVIGCTSMYMFGGQLPEIKKTNLTRDSLVCVNRKPQLPDKFHAFIERSMTDFPNHYYIPQNIEDFRLLFSGVPMSVSYNKKLPIGFPNTPTHESFHQDKVRGFINVPSWIEFLKDADFSFGSRIHGNIISILAGTPSFVFVPDSRILELVNFHNIPHMLMKDVDKNTNILDIYEKTDFSAVHDGHAKRFSNYMDFLKANGIENVYDGKRSYEILPFDKRIANIEFNGPIKSLYSCSQEELAKRIEMGYRYVEGNVKRMKKEMDQISKNPVVAFLRKIKRIASL